MQNRVRASISGSLGVSHCKSGKWLLKTRVTGERRIASKLCDPDELAEAVEMYDLLSLHQHGEGALLNHPEKLSEYHEALADKSKLKSVTDLLAKSDRTYASEFVGVDIKTPGFPRGDMTKFWTSRVNYRDKKTKSKYLPLTRPNEVRAAIYNDLWRLKLDGVDNRHAQRVPSAGSHLHHAEDS